MACRIDGTTISKGITSMVAKELTNSDLFTREGDSFIIKTQPTSARDLIKNINQAFTRDIVKKVSDNKYEISIPLDIVKDYMVVDKDGKEIVEMVGLYNSIHFDTNSFNHDTIFSALNYPQVSSFTNDTLKSFLTSINPDFQIKQVDDLPVAAVTSIKDFMISVRNLSDFKALPEEAAHVFIELLPDNHPLKVDMLANITSFPIYSLTLQKYGNTYQKDGKPDYEKIKREAAAKLVSEFVTAHATKDNSRLEVLAKTNSNFIKRWINKLLQWLGFQMTSKTQAYKDIAGMLMSGENTETLKSAKDIEDISFSDNYFFQMSDEVIYENAIQILEKSPKGLTKIMSDFMNEFGKKFNDILTEERYSKLNDILKTEGDTIGKLNKLSDIHSIFKGVRGDMKSAIDSDTYLTGLAQFLRGVDSLDMLSEAIQKVLTDNQRGTSFNEAIKNIKELQGYLGIYMKFKNMISYSLANALVDAGVGSDVIESITRSTDRFANINRTIMERLRHELFIFERENLRDVNDAMVMLFNDREKLVNQIGVDSGRDVTSMMKKLAEKRKSLYTSDEDIIAMLSGTGKDIDNFSVMNHLLNAAVINGNMHVASYAKYIEDKINAEEQKAKNTVMALLDTIDSIQKALGETADVTGKKITFVDKIWDRALAKEREVLTWLNPHQGIQLVLEQHRDVVSKALEERNATQDRNTQEWKDAEEKYKNAQKTLQDFLQKYYNNPFKKEYYQFRDKYNANSVWVSAMENWEKFTEEINSTELYLSGVDWTDDDGWERLARMKRERANLLNEYDMDGKDKSPSELAEVAILKQYFDEQNQYRERDEIQTEISFKIYQNKFIKTVETALAYIRAEKLTDINKIEKRLQSMLKSNRLRIASLYEASHEKDEPIDFDDIKDIALAWWTSKNIVIRRNSKFWEDEKKLREELDELQKKGELTPIDESIKFAYDEIRNMLHGSRDDVGEINPASLTEEQKNYIIDLEDYIADLKQEKGAPKTNIDDMTDADRQEYTDLTSIIENPNTNLSRKRDALRKRNRLIKKYKNVGTNKRIGELINELGSLTAKIPTQYYWDKMVEFIDPVAEYIREAMQGEPALSETETRVAREFVINFIRTIDNQDWDELDFNIFTSAEWKDFVVWLGHYNSKLADWFTTNHAEKSVFDHENGKYTRLPFVRNAIYEYKSPTRKEHEEIVYNKRFHKSRVKDEYRTGYNPDTGKVELKVGEHISNRVTKNGMPEFLPLTPEQGAPADSPFMNKEYYRMKNSTDAKDKLHFKYLETLKQSHLAHQDMLPSEDRSWMHVPVVGLTHIEKIKHIPASAKSKWDAAVNMIQKNTAAEAEAQAEEMTTTEETDQITQQLKDISERIPKLGMARKIPVERVSKNMLRATSEFIIHTHQFLARSEAHPVVEALLAVQKDNAENSRLGSKELTKVFEKIFSQKILQETPSGALNSLQIRRIAKFLTWNTSLRMLADPIGGIINYMSAMVNNIIEASAGEFLNLNELAKGKYLAGKVNISLVSDYGKKANLGYYTILFNTFDFLQGEWQEDLLDRSSSADKWINIQQKMMIPRKSGELVAQTAVAMGILERTKIENSIDKKLYPIHDIYKKEGSKIVLKEGFPEEWNPEDGKLFMKMKNKINGVNRLLHGNYAKISQTEASRHAIGKLAENMKRWFMPAIQRRFGRETADITFEAATEGYYRTFANALSGWVRALFHKGQSAKDVASFYLKDPLYKRNLQRFIAEIAQAALLFLVFALALGYWGNDKNKELEKNSWIHNASILVFLRVFSETTAYIPIPPLGFQEMKRNVLTAWSLPSDAVSNMFAILELSAYQLAYWFGADSLNTNLYYQKDSGFFYSQKGDSKLLKYVLKTAGYTGYTFEPIQYIKNFNNLQNRLK